MLVEGSKVVLMQDKTNISNAKWYFVGIRHQGKYNIPSQHHRDHRYLATNILTRLQKQLFYHTKTAVVYINYNLFCIQTWHEMYFLYARPDRRISTHVIHMDIKWFWMRNRKLSNTDNRCNTNMILLTSAFLSREKVFQDPLAQNRVAHRKYHYSDVMMSTMASQITGVSMVCSSVCSGANQRKHESSAALVFVRGIYRWPMVSLHKGPVTRKNVSIWWRHHTIFDIDTAWVPTLLTF